MVEYADYKYYTGEFCGTMPETSFKRFSKMASAYLKQITFGRIKEPYITEVKDAMCAVTDILYEDDKRQNKESESNDGYSVSYDVSKTVDAKKYDAAQMYLSGTLLLKMGCYE